VAGGGGAGFAELLAATAGLARRGTGRSVGRVVVFPFAVRVVVVPSGFLILMAPAGAARFLPPAARGFLSSGPGGGGAIRRSHTMQ
jgi:hypothetical protein